MFKVSTRIMFGNKSRQPNHANQVGSCVAAKLVFLLNHSAHREATNVEFNRSHSMDPISGWESASSARFV
jgi:hypothetical protein